MFATIQPFFFDGTDQLSIDEQHRAGIAVKRIQAQIFMARATMPVPLKGG